MTKNRPVELIKRRWRNSVNSGAIAGLLVTINHNSLRGVIAQIILTPKRPPAPETIGICPRWDYAVPLRKSERNQLRPQNGFLCSLFRLRDASQDILLQFVFGLLPYPGDNLSTAIVVYSNPTDVMNERRTSSQLTRKCSLINSWIILEVHRANENFSFTGFFIVMVSYTYFIALPLSFLGCPPRSLASRFC